MVVVVVSALLGVRGLVRRVTLSGGSRDLSNTGSATSLNSVGMLVLCMYVELKQDDVCFLRHVHKRQNDAEVQLDNVQEQDNHCSTKDGSAMEMMLNETKTRIRYQDNACA